MDVSKYRNSDTRPIFDWPLASNNFNQSEIERKKSSMNSIHCNFVYVKINGSIDQNFTHRCNPIPVYLSIP